MATQGDLAITAEVKRREKAGELPKAMKELKDEYTKSGKALTPESIETETQDVRKKLFAALNDQLGKYFPDKHSVYRTIRDPKVQKEYLISFMNDPEGGGSTMTNTTSKISSTRTRGRDIWLTEAELAGPKYYNDAALAKLALGGMESREHRTNAILRQMNVRQYGYIEDTEDTTNETRSSADLGVKCDLDPEHVDKVRDLMLSTNDPIADVPEGAQGRCPCARQRAMQPWGLGPWCALGLGCLVP